MLQGWCVQSSDPRTLGMNSVPKEVIPGQVNFSNLTSRSPSWEKKSIILMCCPNCAVTRQKVNLLTFTKCDLGQCESRLHPQSSPAVSTIL